MAELATTIKRFSILSLGLILVGGIALLGKILLWPERLTHAPTESINVDLHLTGIELSQGRDGKKLWHLLARSAGYTEASNDVTLSQPVITYWGEDNAPAVRVSAPHGQVWQKEDKARMWDGVNATRGEYALYAVTAEYEGSQRELFLQGGVRMIGPTMMASADSLTYFLTEEQFVATGNVLVILN
ncbi:MAG: LPS export ABC transporter periplasmic protein LptC [Desulfovibrionales bacterium]|nr:LPS export ABC transporter periplasmic protein LptC [Desulfovibrionales bacterium]